MDEMNGNDLYKPNSHKYREEQKAAASEDRKKVEKVVTGNVKTKKKSGFGKLADEFISEDAVNVKRYVAKEVIIPGIKDIIEDLVIKGIRLFLRGETGARPGSSSGSRMSYDRCYNGGRDTRASLGPKTASLERFDYEDIVIESRGEAEAVLMQMDEMLSKYRFVSVLDLYDMVGFTAPHTFDKYGWTDLRTAKVMPVRGGYVLKLPRPLPYD